jgi:glyoxylase-like metal-dependent hydrolase (beta-lactamase superfamily II)
MPVVNICFRGNVMGRAGLLVTIVVVGMGVAAVAAQQGPRIPPTGTIERIKGNLWKIPGAGGNTTVFVTDNGVVLVDTKLANNGEPIMKQVRTITDKPVTTIINTHSHPDHMGSNDYFPVAVQKVTHVNAQVQMARTPQYVSNLAVMPNRTFTDQMTLGKGRDQIDLYYFGPGHTNGDAFVVFTALRAMCVGDLMAWKMAPLIDPAAGGSVIALPDTLEKAVNGITKVDTVVEGHGNAITWAEFTEYARFSRALLEAAKSGLGKQTPEEVAAGLKMTFPAFTHDMLLPGMEYGGTPISRAVINVNVAFQELRGEPVTTSFGPPRAGGPGGRGRGAPGGSPAPGGGAPETSPPGR